MHIGARNASTILCDYQIKFFDTKLFPYMETNGIDTILQLGDLFDSRKFSNHIILHKWKSKFFDVLKEKNIKMISLLGNHDIASRNTLEVNTPELFLSDYDNVEIVKTVTTKELCGINFMLIPWICVENEHLIKTAVDETDALFCAGHFEFEGFEMQKGVAAHGGSDVKEFSKFDLVLSGHYHTRSKKKNILYTGVPYEMTWADYNDPKGFHVFDAKTHKVTFVKNDLTLFNRIEYNDKDIEPVTVQGLENTYVKVVVANKTDPYKFEKFITNIMAQNPADLKITDIEVDFDDVEIEDELELEDTKTLVAKFIDQIDTELDKDKLKDMMNALYMSALEVID